MSTPLHVAAITGSLRSGSFSQMVMASIAAMFPEGSRIENIDIGAIPHYNQDLDKEDAPAPVASARTSIAASDLVVIVTPEYNYSLPGVLKNALDWFSRPAFKGCMLGKPVFFLTLSPGALGGVRAQGHLRQILAGMLCELPPLPEIAISHVAEKVGDGRLTDESTLKFIQSTLNGLLARIASPKA